MIWPGRPLNDIEGRDLFSKKLWILCPESASLSLPFLLACWIVSFYVKGE
uniref:Uncharacterized protein n=1 Tax=Utricularia reniformis TaxID=192314 RepID=A0A1Y0AZY6_9LAMI|nr:hypothetical protein AEK19_MT0440 [Utricularia reniformis]ART30703.1 hypothetical protein AEK19_MT0440 [Utricularia reniformis]